MSQFDEVLKAAGFSEYHADSVRPYYEDGLEYIKDAGVPEKIATSKKANGCLVRYILDNYNLNSNVVDLSPAFFRRLKQLQIREVLPDEEDTESESS